MEAPRGSAPPVASSASAAGVANVQSAEQAQTSRLQQALKGAGKQAVVERRPVVENPQPQQSRKVRMQRLRACLVERTTGGKVVRAGYKIGLSKFVHLEPFDAAMTVHKKCADAMQPDKNEAEPAEVAGLG